MIRAAAPTRILVSSLGVWGEEKEALRRTITSIAGPGSFRLIFDENTVTHLVARSAGQLGQEERLAHALAVKHAGTEVVHLDWVAACAAAGAVVPEPPP